MQARPPYTRRNVAYAAIFLLLTAAYGVHVGAVSAKIDEQSQMGSQGEFAFVQMIPSLVLGLYTGAFALVTGLVALVRGSRLIPAVVLLLGLLPTVAAAALVGWLLWDWQQHAALLLNWLERLLRHS